MSYRAEPAIVRFAAQESIATRGRLRKAFQAVAGNPRIIVDLTGANAIDSLAIEEIYRALEAATRRNGRFAVVVRSQRMIRLLSIVGITSRVPIFDSVADAVASMEEP